MVYVDNVVEAIVRSLSVAESTIRGEIFTIGEENPITWHAFYEYFADRLGIALDAPVSGHYPAQEVGSARWWIPTAWLGEAKQVITSAEFKGLSRRVLDTPTLGAMPKWTLDTFPSIERLARRVVGADDTLPVYRRIPPTPNEWVEMGSGGALVSIEKARRMLSFEPPVSSAQGLDLTCKWLEHVRLVT